MKSKFNTAARWAIVIALGAWMAISVIVFLSEVAEGSDTSMWALLASKVLAALSGWACVKTAQWLDKAGWLPSIDYFATDSDGNEL